MPIAAQLLADEAFLKDVRARKLGLDSIAKKYGFKLDADDIRILRRSLREGTPVATASPDSAVLTERHQHSGNEWQISLPKTRIHTLPQLIEFFEVDTDIWETDTFECNKWEVGAALDGVINPEPLFQVKARFKKQRQVQNAKEVVEALIEKAARHAPVYKPIVRKKVKSGVLLELSPFDLHLGKLCWGDETGADYDLNIARRMWEESVEQLTQYASCFEVEKIVLIIGQDFFNVDNAKNETTNGTPQDEDSRWQKSFITAEDMVVKAVDQLRLIAPVEIKVVPGNHDSERSFYLGRMLRAWYQKCKDVEVDCGPGTRRIIHYGRNFIMFTHGDKEKSAILPLLMATEYSKEWHESDFREVHTGHLHQKRETRYTDEYNAVRVRILPSLATADAWHAGRGFKSLPAAEAFIWHPKNGLVAQFSHTPKAGER